MFLAGNGGYNLWQGQKNARILGHIVGIKRKMIYELTNIKPRPYFAEIPYYLWGTVNYDSDGDCKRPTDREWTWIEFTHRGTNESLRIELEEKKWKVTGDNPLAARATLFLTTRCAQSSVGPNPVNHVKHWQHEQAMVRADRVAEEFSSAKLKIFDSHLFWGSWKWIGWYATDFTWVGRWIMVSVLKNDMRGIPLCISWLKNGTVNTNQDKALRLALCELTGESFDTNRAWIRWYDGGLLRKGSKTQYPDPDLDIWLADLKEEYGDGCGIELEMERGSK